MENQLKEFEELLVDYFAGNLSEEDSRRLCTLMKSDRIYRKKYEEMAKVRAKSFVPRFENEKKTNYAELVSKLSMHPNRKHSTFSLRQWGYRIAAVVLLVITMSVTVYYIYNGIQIAGQSKQLCMMEVPLGSQTKVYLPDGTVVCLNSGSTLKYSPSFLKQKTRDVYLTGEGYFEVEKNPERPFIVHTNELKVKVLGTVFNIRSYHEDPEVEVDLVEGKVNVSMNSDEKKNVVLSPDECLIYNKERQQMRKDVTDAKRMTLWTTGRLNFVNTSFVSLMKDIERRYNVKINIESEQAQKEIFSGSIDVKLSIEDVLEYIDVDKKYTWTRKGNMIVVQDKRK